MHGKCMVNIITDVSLQHYSKGKAVVSGRNSGLVFFAGLSDISSDSQHVCYDLIPGLRTDAESDSQQRL